VADIKLIAASLDDVRVEVLPSVGHLLHYEQPARVAALIEQFARG
jgi:pimeloyl-ACP methyl ester carboxylesterase